MTKEELRARLRDIEWDDFEVKATNQQARSSLYRPQKGDHREFIDKQ